MSIALWCVFLAGIMPYLIVLLAKGGGDLDGDQTQPWEKRLTGYKARAYAAHQNAMDIFPFFTIAVMMAEMQRAPREMLDYMALGFIVLRVIYTIFSLMDQTTLRSITWALAWLTATGIFLLPLLG